MIETWVNYRQFHWYLIPPKVTKSFQHSNASKTRGV